ncbi:unnamed protein product [Cuscuta campestris]|uniref:Transposase (putative) gypsy type domain-containing protein n=1 Tax=Cuscuta campestris TaxID=132261 RepID=A0A484MQS4_9ASTE|nr:unnamed protein product [Cuscuta campestris]
MFFSDHLLSPTLEDEGLGSACQGADGNQIFGYPFTILTEGKEQENDMVGPSIKVPRSTSTQTAMDAPSGFFTVHLASLKKGLWFPLHSLLIEFLNEVDLLPCQLVPNSHRYVAGYLVRCKAVGVKPTLDHFLFTFKLTKGHGDWASYASLSQRSSKLFTRLPSFRRVPCPPSDATLLSITRQLCGQGAFEIKKVVTEESITALGFEFVQDELRHQPDLLRDVPGGHQPNLLRDAPGGVDYGPFVEPPGLEDKMDDDLLLGHFVAGRKRKRDASRQNKNKRSSSRGEDSPPREQVVIDVEDQDDAALATGTMAMSSPPRSLMLVQATLGMIEIVGRRQDRQAAMDEAKKVAEDKQRELQEEVARFARELEEEKGRSAVLETKNASISSELGSVSARIAELEGEKTDLIQQLEVARSDQARRMEEAIESFKSSPDFATVAMERMDKLVVEWLKTRPGVQWMVKEGKKSFNCGLFRAQQVFRNKLARLPKGFSFPTSVFLLLAAPWLSSTPALTWTRGAQAPLTRKKKKLRWTTKVGRATRTLGPTWRRPRRVEAPARASDLLPSPLSFLPSISSPGAIYKPLILRLAPPSNTFLFSIFTMSEEVPTSLNLSDGPVPSSPEPASSHKSVNSNDWGG